MFLSVISGNKVFSKTFVPAKFFFAGSQAFGFYSVSKSPHFQSKYEPGKRHWLKVKKDYLCGGAMADSADLVVLGSWYGTGNKGPYESRYDAKDL